MFWYLILSFSLFLLISFYSPSICSGFLSRFAIELIESNQDRLKAAIILKEKLDYNEQMIYHLLLTATVSIECIDASVIWYQMQSKKRSVIQIDWVKYHRLLKNGKYSFKTWT